MNPARRRRFRLSVLVTAALGVALVGGPASVSAQPSGPYVEVTLRDRCIFGGDFTNGATVTLTLKRSGSTVAKSTFKATDTSFNRCLAVAPKGGDRLVFKQVKNGTTLSQRTLELPKLTVGVDLATDTVTGHGERSSGPLDGETALIGLTKSLGGRYMFGGLFSGNFDSNGDLSNSWSGTFDAGPGYALLVQWYSVSNDTVRTTRSLPGVAVRLGKAAVNGTGTPGTGTTITLKNGAGTVRGTANVTTGFDGGDPVFKGFFRKNGAKVNTAVGNKVTSSRLSGSWTVLANTMVIDSGDGDGSVTVTCPTDVEAGLWLDGGNAWSDPYPTGAVSFTGHFIPPGTKVEVVCQDANGFAQWFTGVAP
jgi:hypothetical protein